MKKNRDHFTRKFREFVEKNEISEGTIKTSFRANKVEVEYKKFIESLFKNYTIVVDDPNTKEYIDIVTEETLNDIIKILNNIVKKL
jgi:predicted site-specific integrase-resolvase